MGIRSRCIPFGVRGHSTLPANDKPKCALAQGEPLGMDQYGRIRAVQPAHAERVQRIGP